MSLSVPFEAIGHAVRAELRDGFGDAWIVELFDDSVVFESRGSTWRASYTITGTTITLDGVALIDEATQAGKATPAECVRLWHRPRGYHAATDADRAAPP